MWKIKNIFTENMNARSSLNSKQNMSILSISDLLHYTIHFISF